jgi:septal ring factor EnvC (AmiA/AmiB activator)
LPPNNGKIPGAGFADQAIDLLDLIQRADADADRRDKALPARPRGVPPPKKGTPLSADPTRPAELRSLDAPQAKMLWPADGELTRRFGEADPSGRPNEGLTLAVTRSSLVVAPFDGRVDYTGPFRGYGLVLIIRHDGGYHLVLVGLGRVSVTIGQWLLAGEPIGVMPGADEKDASATLYLELRQDDRPVDPQSRLASRD